MKAKKFLAGSLIAGSIFLYSEISRGDVKQETYSLEKTQEVYQEYDELFKQAKDFDVVTYKEITELHDFLEEHFPYLPKDKNFVQKDPEIKINYKEVVATLENKILKYYPGLTNENSGIRYDADKPLEEEYNNLLKDLIKKTNECYQQNKNNELIPLTKKEQLTVQDLLTFYSILDKSPFSIKTGIKFYFDDLLEHKKAFEDYTTSVEKWRESRPHYITAGIIGGIENDRAEKSIKKHLSSKNNKQTIKIDNKKLEDIFNCSVNNDIGYEIPFEVFFPIPLSFLISVFGVILVKLGVMGYTKRRKDIDSYDLIEIFPQTIGGGLIDAIHPLVFPIRTFGVPVVTEFLRRFGKK